MMLTTFSSFYYIVATPPGQSCLPSVLRALSYSDFRKVPTVDTNLVQSLINIMECQLEAAFEATAIEDEDGHGNSKRKNSFTDDIEGGVSDASDPKVCTEKFLL